MNKLTDEQILALAANAIGHETCGVFAIDRANYYALDGSALIAIGRAVIAAHEATLAAPATAPICEAPAPSLELVEQWLAEIWHEGTPVKVALSDMHIATRAAQWGGALLREHPSARAEDPITPQELNTLWEASNSPSVFARLVLARWGRVIPAPSPPAMERSERCVAKLARTMEVCPTCGNKRCPRATDHNLPCTNSNEPGQPGSRYTPTEKPMSLKDVRTLIADDSFAISFQSLGQYRTQLLKFIDEMIAKDTEMNNCDSNKSSLSD